MIFNSELDLMRVQRTCPTEAGTHTRT